MTRLRVVLLCSSFALAVVALGGACEGEDDELGTPCETDDECSGELICDVHDGKGTCQHDHGH